MHQEATNIVLAHQSFIIGQIRVSKLKNCGIFLNLQYFSRSSSLQIEFSIKLFCFYKQSVRLGGAIESQVGGNDGQGTKRSDAICVMELALTLNFSARPERARSLT